MGMPLARPIFPKEKEIYQLNNDEDFSFVKIAKTSNLVVYFHFFYFGYVMWEVTFKSLLSILQFVGLATNFVVFKKPPLQKGTLDNGKGPNKKNKLDANLFLFFVATLSQKGVPPFNRSQIETKVKSIVETFIVESTCELPPPLLEIKIIRLYVLLLKTYIVIDKKLLEKPKDTMVLLMKL